MSSIAPPERERADSSLLAYEWLSFRLPIPDGEHVELNLRTVRSNVALLDSHVGEELWDAAKLFSAHLCLTSNTADESVSKGGGVSGRRIKGQRVLELGAGVAALGMCVAALGAKQVLCTDYDADVLENMEFNLKHNMPHIRRRNGNEEQEEASEKERPVRLARLDWNSLADSDLQYDELLANTNAEGNGAERVTIARDTVDFDFSPEILIGSALVYSLPGALSCADAIRHFLVDRRAQECWLLQMPTRPGFDRFLLRLDDLGLACETFDISEEVFQTAEKYMGSLKSKADDFKLYVIKMQ